MCCFLALAKIASSESSVSCFEAGPRAHDLSFFVRLSRRRPHEPSSWQTHCRGRSKTNEKRVSERGGPTHCLYIFSFKRHEEYRMLVSCPSDIFLSGTGLNISNFFLFACRNHERPKARSSLWAYVACVNGLTIPQRWISQQYSPLTFLLHFY